MKAILAILALGVVAAMATPLKDVHAVIKPFQCDEDPLIVPPGPMNISLNPVVELGVGSNHQGLIAAGISGIEAEVNIIIITLTATFTVSIPTLEVDVTSADAFGYIDTRPFTALPVGNFTGTGDAHIHLTNLQLSGSATLFINIIGNKVNVRLLSLNTFTFDDLCLDFGSDFTIGGNPVDWVDFCANFKSRFDAEWANNALKNALVEKIRVAANVIVGQYTLEELLDLIGGGDGPTSEPCVVA